MVKARSQQTLKTVTKPGPSTNIRRTAKEPENIYSLGKVNDIPIISYDGANDHLSDKENYEIDNKQRKGKRYHLNIRANSKSG